MLVDLTVAIRVQLAEMSDSECNSNHFTRVKEANELVHKLAGLIDFDCQNKEFPLLLFVSIIAAADQAKFTDVDRLMNIVPD